MAQAWRVDRILLVILLIAGVVAAVFSFAIYSSFFPEWTGFSAYTPSSPFADGAERAKTLWDWLSLLLVPVALAFLAYWLNHLEKRREELQTTVQKAQEELQAKQTALIEEQRFQETTLQAYLGYMTTLLLEKNLRHSQPRDEVRSVARARTLTVLRVLDSTRKATVLQFLYDSILIGKAPEENIISLNLADLAGADLRGAFLKNANLSGANLRGANLSNANMRGVLLTEAQLQGVDLSEAFMKYAVLEGADLSGANLTKTYLRLSHMKGAILVGATMKEIMLHSADISMTNVQGADMRGAKLMSTDWSGSNVTQKQLASAIEEEDIQFHFNSRETLADEDDTSSDTARSSEPDSSRGEGKDVQAST